MGGSAAVCISSLLNEMPGYSLKQLQLLREKLQKAIKQRSFALHNLPTSVMFPHRYQDVFPKYSNANDTTRCPSLGPTLQQNLRVPERSAKSPNVWICAICFMMRAQKLVIAVAVYYAALKRFPSKRRVKCASGCDDKVLRGAGFS